MPELGTLGSVRGDASNGIPYRDKVLIVPDADAFPTAEGNTDGGVSASLRPARRGPETLACTDAP